MVKWIFLFAIGVAAACSVAAYLSENCTQEIDYSSLREPVATLCIDPNGSAATYLVAVPEYVGFTSTEEAALIKQYLKGYCEHIKSL